VSSCPGGKTSSTENSKLKIQNFEPGFADAGSSKLEHEPHTEENPEDYRIVKVNA
jgi:hypothetical protein